MVARTNVAVALPKQLSVRSERISAAAVRRCRAKFKRFFPDGFTDDNYLQWERDYKLLAHKRWLEELDRARLQDLLDRNRFNEIALRAVRIESRTNLLFSFEKMALRDAVKSRQGAKRFAVGLHDLLHGPGGMHERFDRWCDIVAGLPRRQTRVLTWPITTVFGFLAQPGRHIFLKPNVTRAAARAYGFDFQYLTKPSWDTYASLLAFAAAVREDLSDWRPPPRDMIDLQSFIWVLGSDEYDE